MDAVFSLSLPRQAYTVAVARDVLGTLLVRAGVCRGCVDDILLAVSEACDNVIDHGEPASGYMVEAEMGGSWCQLRISHTGKVHDPAALAERFAAERMPLPGLEAESGRGILLMRYLMDEVAFEGEPRTTVLLRKRLTSCDGPSPKKPTGGIPVQRYALL